VIDRDVRRVAIVGGLLVLLFVVVSLGYARRTHYRRLQRCDEVMTPLVAQGAGPDVVGHHLGEAAATYPRRAQADLLERIAAWGPSRQARKKIADAAAQATTSRIYTTGDLLFLAFYDESDKVRQYACLGDTGD
jgi:hypothetical protein